MSTREGGLPAGHRLRARRPAPLGRDQPRELAGGAGGRAGRQGPPTSRPSTPGTPTRRRGRGQPRGTAGGQGDVTAPGPPTSGPSTPGTPTRRRWPIRPREPAGASRGTARAPRPPTSRRSTPGTPTRRRWPRAVWRICWPSRGTCRAPGRHAYQQAIDSGHADAAPMAAVNLGGLLVDQGDCEGARARLPAGHRLRARRRGADGRGRPRGLLAGQGDVDGARAAYQQAIDSGHADAAPHGCGRPRGCCWRAGGRARARRAAYQQAIDSGHADQAPHGRGQPGRLLAEQGDVRGAQGRLPAGHRLRARRRRPAGRVDLGGPAGGAGGRGTARRAAYQQAIDSGHADAAPRAAVNLGELLAEQGDVDGRQGRLPAGHRLRARRRGAAGRGSLGNLLAEQGDVAGARAAYQQAIDSGHADQAPSAAVNLGELLGGAGGRARARAAYQQAIDSGHADQAPMAAVNLGDLLAEQGDVDRVPGPPTSRRSTPATPTWRRWQRSTWGCCWRAGGCGGRRAAYQQAIDSGHADAAPMAAIAWGCCWPVRGMWRAPGRPTSRRSTPGTPARRRWLRSSRRLAGRQGDVDGARAATSRRSTQGT